MILITGATGLVGSHLLLELSRQGKEVRALKRAGADVSMCEKVFAHYNVPFPAQSIWAEGDITDYFSLLDAMEGVDKVYHCAGLVSFSGKDENDLMKINTEGTANVVNVSLEKGIKKLCHVSSTAALGRADNDKVITEENRWKISKNNSAYAVSKYGAEREVWRGMEEGLCAVIVNPANIIGPGDMEKGTGRIVKSIANGLKIYPVGSNAFVDVRDVAGIMIALMESEIRNERFILASENMEYRKVFELIATQLGKPVPSKPATKMVSELAWRMEVIKTYLKDTNPFITHETALKWLQKNIYSNKKIKEELGWNFIPVKEAFENVCRFS